MDTIKKKMLAMKNEKDVALDRAEQLEQNLRDTEAGKNEVSFGILWCRRYNMCATVRTWYYVRCVQ